LRKEIQKKGKRGQALLGRPTSLSAQPGSAAHFPSPLSPARGARFAPPGAGQVAVVRRRWTRRGRPAYTWSGRRPATPEPSTLLPAPPTLLPPRASAAAAEAALRHAPLAPKPSAQLWSPAPD